MTPTTYTTYLFDLDGTLIDSIELILASFRHTFQVLRGEVPPDDAFLEGVGTPLSLQLKKFTDDPAELQAMVEIYREHNLANHDALVREFPGVRDAVYALRDRGARLGIVTSKKRPGTLRGLARCGYDGVFDVLVTADDVERYKPNPEPVWAALQQLDADPAHTVFVGDSAHDLASGRRAGVATGAVLWGPFPKGYLEPYAPTHWLAEAGDLLHIGPA